MDVIYYFYYMNVYNTYIYIIMANLTINNANEKSLKRIKNTERKLRINLFVLEFI